MSSTCCGRSCNQSSVVSSQSWLEECVKMGKSYRDLIAWQKAMDLVTAIYQVSASLPKDEMYGLTSQLRRAAFRCQVTLPKDKDVTVGPSSDIFRRQASGS